MINDEVNIYMNNSFRPKFTENQKLILNSQVSGCCPKCGIKLIVNNGGRSTKRFDIAHIYPLNPNKETLILLKDIKFDKSKINYLDNLIPLCPNCHREYDNGFTEEKYKEMRNIKDEFIRIEETNRLINEYPLREDIRNIIDLLVQNITVDNKEMNIGYQAKKVEEKINDTMGRLKKMKIISNVRQYFGIIKQELKRIDEKKFGDAELISLQIKSFYVDQRRMSNNQEEIFTNIVKWIDRKTNNISHEGSEIIASFFVQNCEVFYDCTE